MSNNNFRPHDGPQIHNANNFNSGPPLHRHPHGAQSHGKFHSNTNNPPPHQNLDYHQSHAGWFSNGPPNRQNFGMYPTGPLNAPNNSTAPPPADTMGYPPQNRIPPMHQRPYSQPLFNTMTRTIVDYKRIEQIGEGTYGQVYKALDLVRNRIVALKKIRLPNVISEGLPRTVIREIKILKALRHENMVHMIDVVSSKGYEFLDEDDERKDEKKRKSKEEALTSDAAKSNSRESTKKHNITSKSTNTKHQKDRIVDAREKYKGNIFLVLEYISHDLSGILDMGFRFTPVQTKCIFRQLLSVLNYMHEHKYVHRDLKSSNILIDERFRVKLADFGLARCLEDERGSLDFTNKVVTLWYRPPELLLGATRYDYKIDIWSAGCIFAELLLGKALFPGKDELEQLSLIFETMGTPTKETWEGFEKHVKVRTKEIEIGKPIVAVFREKYSKYENMTPSALNLLERLLELDPKKRLRAGMALQSQYIISQPFAPQNPEDLGFIDVGGDSHEFQTKPIRREAKVAAQKASLEAKAMGSDDKEAYDKAYQGYLQMAAKARAEGILLTKQEKQKKEEDASKRSKNREDRKRHKDGVDKDRDREKEKSRETDKEREREKEKSRETDKEREREKEKNRETDKEREREKEKDRETDREREREKEKNREADKERAVEKDERDKGKDKDDDKDRRKRRREDEKSNDEIYRGSSKEKRRKSDDGEDSSYHREKRDKSDKNRREYEEGRDKRHRDSEDFKDRDKSRRDIEDIDRKDKKRSRDRSRERRDRRKHDGGSRDRREKDRSKDKDRERSERDSRDGRDRRKRSRSRSRSHSRSRSRRSGSDRDRRRSKDRDDRRRSSNYYSQNDYDRYPLPDIGDRRYDEYYPERGRGLGPDPMREKDEKMYYDGPHRPSSRTSDRMNGPPPMWDRDRNMNDHRPRMDTDPWGGREANGVGDRARGRDDRYRDNSRR